MIEILTVLLNRVIAHSRFFSKPFSGESVLLQSIQLVTEIFLIILHVQLFIILNRQLFINVIKIANQKVHIVLRRREIHLNCLTIDHFIQRNVFRKFHQLVSKRFFRKNWLMFLQDWVVKTGQRVVNVVNRVIVTFVVVMFLPEFWK